MGFIHHRAEIDKNARIGKNCYVAAFAVIRADEGEIKIGNNCSIQEHCCLHNRVLIGNNVTVGHGAIVHGAEISDNVLIGIKAVLLTGCKIGQNCIIAAGALIPEGKNIPDNSVVMGMPGKVVRESTQKDSERIEFSYKAYLKKLEQKGLLED
jgi:carbonic anhydrase/acetyltransferase-like protein (isoleucine patch superfamily)